MLSFISNKRGRNLFYEGFLYKINKTTISKVYFICADKSCWTKLATNCNFTAILSPPHPEHSHEAPSELIEERQFREQVLASIENDPTKRLKDVYDAEIQQTEEETVPNYYNIRTTMSRKRAKTLPPVPKNLHDVSVEGIWANTSSGQPFLLHQDTGFSIFCTHTALRYLVKSPVIICDGTFKCAPTPFTQIYVFFAIIEQHKVPIMWALLGGKTQQHYELLVLILQAKCLERFQTVLFLILKQVSLQQSSYDYRRHSTLAVSFISLKVYIAKCSHWG